MTTFIDLPTVQSDCTWWSKSRPLERRRCAAAILALSSPALGTYAAEDLVDARVATARATEVSGVTVSGSRTSQLDIVATSNEGIVIQKQLEARTVYGRIGYKFGPRLRFELVGFNLTDNQALAIDYFYISRLPGEPVGGIDDIHFHPIESRSFRLSMQATL